LRSRIEADENGWKLLNKAKIDPRGMIVFFETMKKEQGNAEVSEFISTHPATAERIKNLEKKKPENSVYIYFPLNFDQFKTDIATYLKQH
jgi:beta-barrel assembly-enhancing protease